MEILETVVLIGLVATASIAGMLVLAHISTHLFGLLLYLWSSIGMSFSAAAEKMRWRLYEYQAAKAERQRREHILRMVSPVDASPRPDQYSVRASKAHQRANNCVDLLRETAGACSYLHRVTASALGAPHMRALKSEPECTGQREEMEAITVLTLETMASGELRRDPIIIKQRATIRAVRTRCGPKCSYCECSVNSLPPMCEVAMLLGYQSADFVEPNE